MKVDQFKRKEFEAPPTAAGKTPVRLSSIRAGFDAPSSRSDDRAQAGPSKARKVEPSSSKRKGDFPQFALPYLATSLTHSCSSTKIGLAIRIAIRRSAKKDATATPSPIRPSRRFSLSYDDQEEEDGHSPATGTLRATETIPLETCNEPHFRRSSGALRLCTAGGEACAHG